MGTFFRVRPSKKTPITFREMTFMDKILLHSCCAPCSVYCVDTLRGEGYGLRDFVRAVAADIDHRCAHCYTIRLGTAAKYASEHGYEAFTSSLLISPYQNHELLKAVGETMARKYGVEFLYRDFRPGFRAGQAKAREMGLYLQKYCGCIFSEEDRYEKKIGRARMRFAEE